MNISSNKAIQPINGIYHFDRHQDRWRWILENKNLLIRYCKNIRNGCRNIDEDLSQIYILTYNLLKNYDPSKNIKVSTYICNYLPYHYMRWIDNQYEIKRAYSFEQRLRHISLHRNLFYKNGKLDYLAVKKKYKNVSDEYIQRLEFSLDCDGKNFYCVQLKDESLDLLDKLYSKDFTQELDDKIDKSILINHIYNKIKMPKNWNKVLRMRTEQGYTFEYISKSMGYSKARAHQIYTKVINKLRSEFKNYGNR